MEVDPRDLRPGELERLLAEALARLAAQDKRVAALERENAELRRRLGLDSHNSSRPPSTDGPKAGRREHKSSGRRRGGQPGHEGHQRRLLEPDAVREVRPPLCDGCGYVFPADAPCEPDPERVQHIEIPPVRPHVSEDRLCACVCPRCHRTTKARIPPGGTYGAYGARLAATIAVLGGRFHLSKRQIVEALRSFFGVELSLGSVCALEREVGAALAAPVAEAAEAVRVQPVAYMDETGWREQRKRAWLWVAVTRVATVFVVARSRGAAVAKMILGSFAGILVTDRCASYLWVGKKRRQVCWAHILRDVIDLSERGGNIGGLAGEVLVQAARMFEWWKKVRDGPMSRAQFQQCMESVRREVKELLGRMASCAPAPGAGKAKAILALEPALWTFVDVEGVEPTNNVSERTVRKGVMWRKTCFGTDSADGSRFVERILTATATLRQHGRNVLDYVEQAVRCRRRGMPVASLLPAAPAVAPAASPASAA